MLLELPTPDDPLIRESNKEEEEDTETLTRFLRTCQWVYSSNSPPAKHVKVHSRSMKLASSYTLIPRGFFDKGVHQDEFSYEQAVYSQFYFHTDTLIIENDVESENIQFLCRYIEETELQCKTVELWNVRIDVHDDDFNRLFRLLSAQTLVFNYNGDYPRNNKGLTFSQIGEVYITCESIEEEHIGQLKSPDLTIGCKFISENSVIAIIQQWYDGEREIEKLCLTQQAHHIDIKTIRKRLELMQIHLSPMDKNAYNAPATAISMYHVGAPEKDEDLLIIVAEKNVTIAKLRVSPAEFMRKYEGIEKLLGSVDALKYLLSE